MSWTSKKTVPISYCLLLRVFEKWLRRLALPQRSLGYEPSELNWLLYRAIVKLKNHSLEKQPSKGEAKSLTDNFRAIVHANHNIISSCHQPAMHKFVSSLLISYRLSAFSSSKLSRHIVCNLTNDFILYLLLAVSFKWLVGEDSNLYVECLVCGPHLLYK